MDGLLIALVLAALMIGSILMLVIHLTSKRARQLDREMYQKVWRAICRGADTKKADSLQMAIIKADKLLDKAMKDSGISGQTTGDRLKASADIWSRKDAVWAAHKLRNQIAHEHQVKINSQTFKRAMAGFEAGLKDLGAL